GRRAPSSPGSASGGGPRGRLSTSGCRPGAGAPGCAAEAPASADNTCRLFRGEWARRNCPENYNAVTGEALDQPDTDSFYGWGALMPMMAVGDVTDVNPWNGWEISHGHGDVSVGPLLTPAGPPFVQSVSAWL